MKKFLFIILWLGLAIDVIAQSKLSAYTQIVIADQSSHRGILRAIDNNDYLDAMIFLNDNSDLDSLRDLGVIINVAVKGAVTAQIPLKAINNVCDLEDVKYIHAATMSHIHNDQAIAYSNHQSTLNGTASTSPYDGTGVIYGTLDVGVDFNHAAFRNADGTTRILSAYLPYRNDGKKVNSICYDSSTGELGQGTLPGSVFDTDAAIKALTTDTENASHGTHTMATAAGTHINEYGGFAPGASLISAASSSLSSVNIVNSVAYVFDQAQKLNMPAVVNLSLGNNAGRHTQNDFLPYFIDQLVGEGKIVVISAGNEGNQNMHIQCDVSSDASALGTFLTGYNGDGVFDDDGYDFWTRTEGGLRAQLSIIDSSGNILDYSNVCDESNTLVSISNWSSYFSGSIEMGYGTLNNYSEVYIKLNGQLKSGYYIRLIMIGTDTGLVTVDGWGNSGAQFSSLGYTGYLNGTPDMSINAIACGNNSISIGAYTTREKLHDTSNNWHSIPGTLEDIAPFSSYGPSPDGRTLPTVAAPGHTIISAVSNYDSSMTSSKYIYDNKSLFSRNNIYHYMSGTSMSAPAASGIIATWLQANPALTPDDIKLIISDTAITDDFTAAAPNRFGYGKINSYEGLNKALQLASVETVQEMKKPMMIFPNPNDGAFKVAVAGCDDLTVEVYDVSGALVASRTISDASGFVDIDLRGELNKGSYIVRVRSANYSTASKMLVK